MQRLGWMVVLAAVAVACGTGADMVGEMMDSGVPDAGAQGGSGGNGSSNGLSSVKFTEVPCDQTAVNITRSYDTDCQRDAQDRCIRDEFGNTITVRTNLRATTTRRSRYALVDVEDQAEIFTRTCGYRYEVDPPYTTSNSPSQEVVRDEKVPATDCYVNHGGGFIADGRLLLQCETVTETVFDKSNPDYNPVSDVDRTITNGNTRHYVGTR